MRAILKNYRQSPRKVRLVSNLVKGLPVDAALLQLKNLTKRASDPIAKVIASASANATKNFKMDASNLVVKSITVDKGVVLKRSQPRSRGMANPIHKHTSTVVVELASK
jgi:large subunit ribosomal protein L22